MPPLVAEAQQRAQRAQRPRLGLLLLLRERAPLHPSPAMECREGLKLSIFGSKLGQVWREA